VEGYRVQIKRSAARELEAIQPRSARQRIVARIQALASDPRPTGCAKLFGSDRVYRVRDGVHRVVYEVDDVSRVVDVVKVGHRREIYR